MTPEQAIAEAQGGELRPIYVVVGEEGFEVERVVHALRQGADTGVAKGFNEDRFVAQEARVETVVNAALTAPMMARQRLVVLSAVDRWDRDKGGEGSGSAPLDALADYAADPAPSTVMVITASKINGSRRLMRFAKKGGFLVSCKALARRDLPGWIRAQAKRAGHGISAEAVESLAELMGPELGPLVDALERLSLYVGPGNPIDEDALTAVVTRVRQETVWALVDALVERNLSGALAALHDAYDDRDRGLPLLGAIAARVRQLIKLRSALDRGQSPAEAAGEAGVPPFKAGELARVVRRLPSRALPQWLLLIAEADLALKGSRRQGSEVLATMLVEMCR